MTDISLAVTNKGIPAFFPLLQRGFTIKAQVGCSIQDMLCRQFNINPDYIEERISTVFLDAKPVDDVESAIIRNGAILALSAAMPGLVGATLRRGGPISSFRSTITYSEKAECSDRQEGFVILKLFNLLLKELGPNFLKQGIWIPKNHLHEFVKQLPDIFSVELKKIEIDGRRSELKTLAEPDVMPLTETIRFRVSTNVEVEAHN